MKLDDRAIFISKMAPDAVKMLRQVISTQLGVDAAVLTDETDLFCLGLDSMRTMRIASRLRQAGIPVKFSELVGKRNFVEWKQAVIGNQEPQSVGIAVIVDERTPFELATMQHAFWVGRSDSQPLGGVAAHFYTEFDGQLLNPTRLNRALVALVARHPQLRIRVTQDGKQQVLDRAYRTEIVIRDYRGKSPKEQAALLQQLRHDLSHQRLDVEQGSVFDISLTLLDNNRARLHFDLDMIAGDAVSLRIILLELAALYQDPNLRLPEIGLSYQQYLANVKVQRAEDRARDQAWWADYLATLAPPPNLPLRSESGESDTPAVTRYYHWLSPDDKARLHALSKQYGLTVSAVLATAFTEVVGAWSGGERFLLNLPVFNRQSEHEDIDRIIGDFSSSVLLTVEPGTVDSFTEQAHILQQELHTAAAHMAYSGVDVLRDLSRLNDGEKFLAPVVFTSALELGDLYEPIVQQTFGEPVWSISQGPQVLLDAQVTEHSSGILLNWDVRESMFVEDVVPAIFDAFRAIVECLLEDERNWSLPFTALCLAMGAPRLVAEKDNRRGTAPVSALLYQRFFDQAARNPSAAALILGGQSALSYGELAQKALGVAGFLHAEGIGPGQSVAITMPKGNEQIVATLGVLAAGATYVPSGIDLPSIRRQQVYETAGIALVLAGSDRALWPEWPDKVRVVSIENVLQARPLVAPVIADADAPMYVIFTSGSTGTPKGVEVSHRSVANTIDAVNKLFEIGPQDSTLTLSELDFDLSAYDLFAFLSCGASVVVVEEHQRRDAPAWVELMKRWDITVISCVPAILDMILVVAEGKTLPHWRLVMLGGDRISRDLPSRFQKVAPGARFVGLGGMTEAAIHSTVFEVHDLDDDWTSVPFGKPLKNMRCRVVDRLGRDCPYWVTGELWVSGLGVAIGYRNDPHRTAERFVYLDGHRWYRTGDLVRQRADNNLEFLGRADNQVKIRGHRIELGEVEAAVAGHQAVDKAFVTVIALSSARQLSAVVTLNQACDIDSLRVWASERLPHYSVPDHYLSIDSFPLTYNGKIDRKRLQKLAEETAGSSRRVVVPPQGRMEQIVAKLWRELLNMSEISRDDSFFVCGGDSLIATRLISRLAQEGVRGHLAQLFSEPTLAVFSATLSFEQDVVESEIEADLAHRFDPFPLTDIQRAFWIGRSEQMILGGVGSHFYIEFDGEELDIPRLEQAWHLLIQRHDMLRAVVTEDGQQRVLQDVPDYQITIKRIADIEAVESKLQQMRDQLSHKVYEVTRWPLFEIQAATYKQASVERCHLFVSLDSIMLDARSIMVLFTEWDQLYRDRTTPLPELRIQYRDYVTQRQPDENSVAAAESYWRERVGNLPDAPRLPLAVTPDSIDKPEFIRFNSSLDAKRWQYFKARAQKSGITPTVALLSAYGEVLSTWSNQQALSINLTMFDRHPVHLDIDRVVGDFASIMLVGYEACGNDPFITAARKLQARVGEGLAHREISGIRVLRELAKARQSATISMPLVFTSVLGMADDASMDLSETFPAQCYGLTQTSQVWLDVKVSESHDRLMIEWDGVEALFPSQVLSDMFNAYMALLESLIEESWELPVQLPLPEAQLQQRCLINATEQAALNDQPLYLRFFEQAEKTPDAPALLWGADEAMSYGELAEKALRVASYLRENGLNSGDCVGITHPKGPDQVVAVMGVLAGGGCYVPSGVDLPVARRELVYNTANIVLVLTDEDSKQQLKWPPLVPVITVGETFRSEPMDTPVQQSADALKYIIFTSGSTGIPKGVEISHRAVANTIDAVSGLFDISAQDRTITLSALDFDLSAYDLFAFLSAGASVVVVEEHHRRDAHAWVELINGRKVSVISCVPALLDMILIATKGQILNPGIRLVMLGGDRITRDLPERFWGIVPDARFVALGGMTEAAIHSTVYEVMADDPQWASAPYGRPLANMKCRVADAHGKDCPNGVIGELWVSGRGLAKGYRGDPERTAEKFVEYDSTRWYCTGDLARYNDQSVLEFFGRADNQVKIRGHRIELGEVEGGLVKHPEINSAAVVLLERASRKLGAAVVASKSLDLAQVKAGLDDWLPSYEVPEYLVQMERLPLTTNGKVDRDAIREYLQATITGETEDQRREAATPAEVVVSELWQELLSLDHVGRTDNFFTLGGDSLVATRLMSRLQAHGYRGELATLFTHPVLADFARSLSRLEVVDAAAIKMDRANRYEPFPLTDVQEAYWLGRRNDFALGGISAQMYNEYEFPGLDVERLEVAWNALIDRHEMLRARILPEGQQVILEEVPRYVINRYDLRGASDQAEQLEQIRDSMSREKLDPHRGPLFDIRVIHYGEKQTRLAVLLDNIIVDGLSMLALFSELFQIYNNVDIQLSSIGLSFRDYLLGRNNTDQLKDALKYWQKRLASLPQGPSLPTVRDPGTVINHRFTRTQASIETSVWSGILEKARAAGITPSAVLLTCFAEILSRWSGQTDLVINMTLFDRKDVHPDVNRVVGDFTSLILVSYNALDGNSWLDRARRLQAQIWKDLDHQEVSAVRVLREIARANSREVKPVPVVFTSMLGVADALAKSVKWPDFTCSQTPQVWLDHQVIDLEDGLLLSWDYVEELFSADLILTMFAEYRASIEALATVDWEAPVIRLLPEAQHHVRKHVNATQGVQPEALSAQGILHRAFFRHAKVQPEEPALWCRGQGVTTYGELADQALRVAAYLAAKGVRSGDNVAVSMPKGSCQIAAVLGVICAGATYVPVGIGQPKLRKKRIYEQAAVAAVLVDQPDATQTTTPVYTMVEALTFPPVDAPRAVNSNSLAYIIFTSGSTGEPKGVEIEHCSALNTVDDICSKFAVAGQDRILGVSALDFDLSVFDIFGALNSGAMLCLTGEDDRRDPDEWMRLIEEQQITVWNSVPAQLEMLITVTDAVQGNISSLRLALVSGDWVGLELRERLAKLAPDCMLVALGGATEASIWSNYWIDRQSLEGWKSAPYGMPLRNQQFRVVGPFGEDAPDWVPGELWIGGHGVARGYCNDASLSQARFSGEYPQRWYRTGDIGRYRPDGTLEFLGRLDYQVKIRGHRIELGEIEATLHDHPGVRKAVAIVHGTGAAARICVFVEPLSEQSDLDDLLVACRAQLPGYAVPSAITYLSQWPLTTNGKIDRKALVQRVEDNAVTTTKDPISDLLEQQVAGLWQQLVGEMPMSRSDNFFAMGGNSLLGTRLVAQLSTQYGVNLSLRAFFADATIAGLAATVEKLLDQHENLEEGQL